MNTQQMLLRLKHSGNKITADHAESVLSGKLKKSEIKRLGGLFDLVMAGRYEDALKKADDENYRALTGTLT